MKNNTNPTLHDTTDLNLNAHAGNAAVRLGLDVDLHFVVTAIQCDHGTMALPQKFTRTRLVDWVERQVAAGHKVHTVYESCSFAVWVARRLL